MTEPAEPTEPAEESPGHDTARAARESWRAVLALHGDLEAHEWAELWQGDDEQGPGAQATATRTDPR